MSLKGMEAKSEAAPLLDEFNRRQRLAELGYRTPLKELSAFKAECFILISTEIDRVKNEEHKAKMRGRG